MTKYKNIQYMKTYEKKLEREIEQADEKKVRIDMRQNKNKYDLKEIKLIIKAWKRIMDDKNKKPQTFWEGLYKFGIVCACIFGVIFVIYLLMTCGI